MKQRGDGSDPHGNLGVKHSAATPVANGRFTHHMHDLPPETSAVDIADARESLDEPTRVVSQGKARVIVQTDGQAVAAIVSLRDLDQILAQQRRWDASLETQREMAAAFSGVSPVEAEAEIDRLFDAMRSANRATDDLAAAG